MYIASALPLQLEHVPFESDSSAFSQSTPLIASSAAAAAFATQRVVQITALLKAAMKIGVISEIIKSTPLVTYLPV